MRSWIGRLGCIAFGAAVWVAAAACAVDDIPSPTPEEQAREARDFLVGMGVDTKCAAPDFNGQRLRDNGVVEVGERTPLFVWNAGAEPVVLHDGEFARVAPVALAACDVDIRLQSESGTAQVCVDDEAWMIVDGKVADRPPGELAHTGTAILEESGERVNFAASVPDGTIVAVPDAARVTC